jgi:hypothetical protein
MRAAAASAIAFAFALAVAGGVAAFGQYSRSVAVTGAAVGGQVCAQLDVSAMEHAAPDLSDLRLFDRGREIQYTLTLTSTDGKPEADDNAFTTLAKSSAFTRRGNVLTVEIEVPEHAPVERILLVPVASAVGAADTPVAIEAKSKKFDENVNATLGTPQANGDAVNAAFMANEQTPAKFTISVGDPEHAAPQFALVQLQMRQRLICFAPAAGGQYQLAYGSGSKQAKQAVDGHGAANPSMARPVTASLGPEIADAHSADRAKLFEGKKRLLLGGMVVLAILIVGTLLRLVRVR